jgi:hypothetical protein
MKINLFLSPKEYHTKWFTIRFARQIKHKTGA